MKVYGHVTAGLVFGVCAAALLASLASEAAAETAAGTGALHGGKLSANGSEKVEADPARSPAARTSTDVKRHPRASRLHTTHQHTGRRRVVPAGYVPRHERFSSSPVVSQPIAGASAALILPEPVEDDVRIEMGSLDSSGWHNTDSRSDPGCGSAGCLGSCCWLPSVCCLADNVTYYFGAQGTKGPVNRGTDSSFGFRQGINMGAPLGGIGGLGFQLGFEATQSNLSGAMPRVTTNQRNQTFFTGGVFRRARCGPQVGVVFDYLHDNWDATIKLGQIRGELSWVNPCCHELGFWFAVSTQNDTEILNTLEAPNTNLHLEPTDLFALFYRHQLQCGGQGRAFVGWSGGSDGLLGGDLVLPICDTWALGAEVAYLIPEASTGATPNGGNIEESWNVGIRLIWYPRGTATSDCSNLYRPMFNVANNGSFMVDAE